MALQEYFGLRPSVPRPCAGRNCGVTPKQLLTAEDSNASATTLSEASWQLSNWFPRGICNRIERGPAALGEPRRERKTCERTKSPLRQFATTTERNFWQIKLAEHPKSFCYPYSTLRNVAVLEELCPRARVNLLELCGRPHRKVADIGAADGDLAFFLEETWPVGGRDRY